MRSYQQALKFRASGKSTGICLTRGLIPDAGGHTWSQEVTLPPYDSYMVLLLEDGGLITVYREAEQGGLKYTEILRISDSIVPGEEVRLALREDGTIQVAEWVPLGYVTGCPYIEVATAFGSTWRFKKSGISRYEVRIVAINEFDYTVTDGFRCFNISQEALACRFFDCCQGVEDSSGGEENTPVDSNAGASFLTP